MGQFGPSAAPQVYDLCFEIVGTSGSQPVNWNPFYRRQHIQQSQAITDGCACAFVQAQYIVVVGLGGSFVPE